MKPYIPALLALAALALAIYLIPFDYVYVPSDADALNTEATQPVTYDLWGRTLSEAEAGAVSVPSAGALVRVDEATVRRGREAFYGETFGDEIFLTDVLGVIDGPLTVYSFAKALMKLRGAGTTNLQLEVRRTMNVGGREFAKGSLIDTGLDVAKGAYAPLGMKIVKRGARIRVGMTCAVCHSTVDPETKKVVHGAPNTDLNAGLLLALATNSAAYFFHTDVSDLSKYVLPAGRQVLSADHTEIPLPDRGIFERAVDAALLAWPPGYFDSMIDFKAAPTQIPSSFTREAYPYGWSGFAAAGPFGGLSSLNNNVHALNSDSLTDAYLAQSMFGLDPELYIALVLQNAPRKKFRFDPKSGRKPSEFLRAVDPTPGGFGLNHTVELPHFPKGSILAPDGLLASVPGGKIWEDVDAIAAWENSLTPPRVGEAPQQMQSGRQVFERARCDECHQGPALTNHRVVPAALIGTDPVRAQALARTEGTFAPPVLFALNQPVPLPQKPVVLDVPTDGIDKGDLERAFAWDGAGGYKVPALVGLRWTAPYLHDGGVAVGKNPTSEIGVPGTLLKGIAADPANSLLALVDRTVRARVVSANQDDARLKRVNVRGIGHEFWVDADGGYSAKDQVDLIRYLLSAGPAQTPPKP